MKDGHVFYTPSGDPCLVECPRCKERNDRRMIATGQCAWCGFLAERKE